jgi:hypothetical protein
MAFFFSTFRNGAAIDEIARVIGSCPKSVERMLQRVGIKNIQKKLGPDPPMETWLVPE